MQDQKHVDYLNFVYHTYRKCFSCRSFAAPPFFFTCLLLHLSTLTSLHLISSCLDYHYTTCMCTVRFPARLPALDAFCLLLQITYLLVSILHLSKLACYSICLNVTPFRLVQIISAAQRVHCSTGLQSHFFLHVSALGCSYTFPLTTCLRLRVSIIYTGLLHYLPLPAGKTICLHLLPVHLQWTSEPLVYTCGHTAYLSFASHFCSSACLHFLTTIGFPLA